MESKSTFRSILNFAYWRGVWASNYYKAAIRYIRNYMITANRIVSNYTLLYLRLMSLNISALIRVLSSKFRRPAIFRSVPDGVHIPNLGANLGSVTTFDLWSSRDLLYFVRQRYFNKKRDDTKGKWISVSKRNSTQVPVTRSVSADLIFHVHYLEIAIEMIDYLVASQVIFSNVVITCTDDGIKPILESAAKKLAQNRLEVINVENSYRDARPFLIAVHRLEGNLPILKIHTKKSPHLSELDGIAWRQSLLEELVPNSIRVAEFASWLTAENVPMAICPKRWLAEKKHWGRNDFYVFSICKALGITMSPEAPFPMGSMFWANKPLIEHLKMLPIPGSQDVREMNWADSTWSHGFERAIGQIIANGGKGVALL